MDVSFLADAALKLSFLNTYFKRNKRTGTMTETTTAVNIHMISSIKRDGAQVDRTSKELKGELIEKGTSYYLSYQENDPELGMSQHVLKLGIDQGVIMRRGAVSHAIAIYSW
jgi:uncharacterized beta-barrel protein YwiB (DUF1934 family)